MSALRGGVLTAVSAWFPLYYTVAFYNELTIAYYPTVAEIHIGSQATTIGPAIGMYSWVIAAFIASVLSAIAMPANWRASLWPGWLWLGPAVATVFTLIYELRWLMPAIAS